MFESRCGVCCDSCERRDTVNCKGCIHMEKPFWGGECMVKSCCEKKGQNHCGECTNFPCKMFTDMGKEQGYRPEPRIEQCKAWGSR
jgi:hypothetical protein